MTHRIRVPRRIVAPVAGITVFLALWQLFVDIRQPKRFILRSPAQIIRTLLHQPAKFFHASVGTATEALVGFAMALLVGLLIGAVLSASRWLEEAANPILTLIQVTPFVAYVGSISAWLGFGTRKVPYFLATFVCVPAFAFASTVGLRSADADVVEVFRSLGASRLETTFRLRIPAALPQIFVAARFCVGLSLIAAYFSEAVVVGLGSSGTKAIAANNGDGLWAVIFCMAMLGTIGLLLIAAIERVVLHWHVSQHSDRSSSVRGLPFQR
jgi:NitT/TauT family transport system permease protein